jgi:hypothetical protein
MPDGAEIDRELLRQLARDPAARALAAHIGGGLQLRPPVDPKVLRRGTRGAMVRNVETGRILPCCYAECMRAGRSNITVELPHNAPRWRDELTGQQEMLVYIYCSDQHRAAHWKDTPIANRL